ncbi:MULTISPECIES: DUF7096 domain-containing protein [Halorussus]|uniref:DUF7096 domain-containing protein n=1 Tax=Halorussus TaxID=1070314 RepID=UPI00209D5050|nr:hypothetical protein [Halorussus vallis]USZ77273.1 hypothetical protein NGM07_08060 [Halorussus vallis]
MRTYRAVLLALLAACGALAVATPTGAVATDDAVRPGYDAEGGPSAAVLQSDAPNDNASANATLGADISAFMQSNAAEIGGAVETGMWTAAFNATDNASAKERLVDRRTRQLQKELQALQQRKQRLVERHEAGNLGDTAYKAQVSHLLGRINALQSAVNTTISTAASAPPQSTVGATAQGTARGKGNLGRLRNIGQQAANLSGPEIAAVARNTSGVGLENGRSNGAKNGLGVGNATGPTNGSNGLGVGPGSNGNRGNGQGPQNGAGNPGGEAPLAGDGTNATLDDPVTGPTVNGTNGLDGLVNDSTDGLDAETVADAFDHSATPFGVLLAPNVAA